jgi:hypothetical protein
MMYVSVMTETKLWGMLYSTLHLPRTHISTYHAAQPDPCSDQAWRLCWQLWSPLHIVLPAQHHAELAAPAGTSSACARVWQSPDNDTYTGAYTEESREV